MGYFGQRDVQIVNIHRHVGRHRRRRGVFHELEVEGAADAYGREALPVNQLGQCQRGARQAMRTQPRNDIDHGGFSRLQPKRELQLPARGGNQHRPRLAPARELGILEGEEDRFERFQGGWVRFPFHLEISHPVLPHEGPGILKFGIGIHFGPGESHIIIHGIAEVVIQDPVGDVGVGTDVGQRVGRH